MHKARIPQYETEVDAARDRVSEQVLRAQTLAEVREAEEALRQWLREHPEEGGMRDGFELLAHLRDHYEWLEANPEEAKAVRARNHARNLVYEARTLAECAEARAALCQCVRDFPDDDLAADFQFLALWEEGLAFMEQEGASLEPEKALAGV